MLSLIYARTRNGCIGDQGRVPWQLPNEYAAFDRITRHSAVIMGRKTYEDHCCELPNRLNIVVSGQTNYALQPGIKLASSLDDALAIAEEHSEQYFVIGGVALIIGALERSEAVYETIIDTHIAGDSLLPTFDFKDWETTTLLTHDVDADHAFAFCQYRHTRRI